MAVGDDPRFGHLIGVGLAVYGGSKHVFHGTVKLAEVIISKVLGQGIGVDPCLEKDLVGVDISNAGDALLIHKGRFYGGSPPGHGLSKGVEVEGLVQGVVPHIVVLNERLDVSGNTDSSEFSLVVVRKVVPVGEGDEHAIMGCIIIRVLEIFQITGHSEVQSKPLIVFNRNEEMFAVTSGAPEVTSRQCPFERTRRDTLEDVVGADVDLGDFLVQRGRVDVSFEDLYVREFRHR
jgi:hypothetical protein